MQGTKLEPWEVRSAVLASNARTLNEVARDEGVPLSPGERKVLERVAEKVRVHAREVVRRG